MKEVVISLRFRLFLAVAALALGWMVMGPFGLVFFSPIAGICLARPLLDKMAGLYYQAKETALQEFQGKYYSFRGTYFDIHEDQAHHRWLRTSDVRTLLPSFPRDGVLLKLCAEGLAADYSSERRDLKIRADVLDKLLSSSRQLETIKFRNWLQKDVLYPAEQRRERHQRATREVRTDRRSELIHASPDHSPGNSATNPGHAADDGARVRKHG